MLPGAVPGPVPREDKLFSVPESLEETLSNSRARVGLAFFPRQGALRRARVIPSSSAATPQGGESDGHPQGSGRSSAWRCRRPPQVAPLPEATCSWPVERTAHERGGVRRRMLARGSADFGPWRCCATGPVARATEPAPRLARLPKSDSSANVGITQCFLPTGPEKNLLLPRHSVLISM